MAQRPEYCYMATPYSVKNNPELAHARFRAACAQLAFFMRQGRHMYGPISMSVPTAEWGLPQDFRFWAEYDRNIVSRCDRLVVVMLPGWTDSTGICAEIGMAIEFGIPVEFVEPCADAVQELADFVTAR